EDGGDGAVGHAGAGEDVGGEVDLAQGGVGVLCLARPTAELGGGVGVEVAVPAADPAERDVEVDTEVALRGAARRRGGQGAVGGARVAGREGGAHFFALASFPVGESEPSAAMKASCGTSTRPMAFIRFLPSFCFSRSLRLREMSPP